MLQLCQLVQRLMLAWAHRRERERERMYRTDGSLHVTSDSAATAAASFCGLCTPPRIVSSSGGFGAKHLWHRCDVFVISFQPSFS